jgi:microcystin-dependent protein
MSGFNYNNLNAFYPVGSIISYLGTTDPDGWVICDGVARADNADGRYNRLYALGIGTGGSGTSNYTPPNLSGKYLYGKGSSDTIGNTGGNASVTLTSGNLPAHSHNLQHGHYCYGRYNESGDITGEGNTYQYKHTGLEYIARYSGYYQDRGCATSTASTGTTQSTGNSTSFSILPNSLVVNYILKY